MDELAEFRRLLLVESRRLLLVVSLLDWLVGSRAVHGVQQLAQRGLMTFAEALVQQGTMCC